MGSATLLVLALAFFAFMPSCTMALTSSEYYSYDDVLLLNNTNSTDSVAIAGYFAKERGITHIVNITTVNEENINHSRFLTDIVHPIQSYLDTYDPAKNLNYIVSTKGIPIRVLNASQNPSWNGKGQKSLDSLLAVAFGGYKSYAYDPNLAYKPINPYYGASAPFSRKDYDIFLITRLDAYTVDEAKGLIDRAKYPYTGKDTYVVVDEPYPAFFQVDYPGEYVKQAVLAEGYLYYKNNASGYFLPSYSNVIGYYGWGDNDPGYWAAEAPVINNEFRLWDPSNTTPTGWVVESGHWVRSWPRSGFDLPYVDNETAKANLTGLNRICQTVTVNPGFNYYFGCLDASCRNIDYYSMDSGAKAWLEWYAYDSLGNQLGYGKSKDFTGTNVGGWVSLRSYAMADHQWFRYEAIDGATSLKTCFAADIKSDGQTVYLNNIFLVEIKPNMGWKNGSIAENGVSTSARTFRKDFAPLSFVDNRQLLIADEIENGVTGVKGYVNEPQLSALANAAKLFAAYLNGSTLVDAFYHSSLYLAWMDVVIGDPKAHIADICLGCGAGCESKCPDGEDCISGADCQSDYCNPDGECSTPSCTDGWWNGDETGIDCGGSCISGAESVCSNGIDDDKDCLMDCLDLDCNGLVCDTDKTCQSGVCTQQPETPSSGGVSPGFEAGALEIALAALAVFVAAVAEGIRKNGY